MDNTKVLHGQKIKYAIEEKTVGQFFFNRAKKYDNRICQIDGTDNKSETFASVKLRSTRTAIAMQKNGITSDDVVIVCSSNTLDNTIPIIAASYLGAKIANLEPSLSVRHTKHLLSLVTPKIIFVEESAVNLIEESLIDTSFTTKIVSFGNSEKYDRFSYFVKLQENEENFRPVDVDPNDLAVMFFSSGTTGLPKAICHSHRTFLLFTCCFCQGRLTGTMFHFTSFYWMTAMMMLSCSFEIGSPRVFCRKPSTEDIFRIIETYKVETIFTAPILTYKFTSFENAENFNTSSIKFIICSGTAIAPSQLQKVREMFRSAFVALGYGMSEVGILATFIPEFDQELAYQKLSSCGKPGPGMNLKVVDISTEQQLGPNQTGEIRVKCPSMMTGYYKLDSSQVLDNDGFLKTGDMGYYDEDECVYLVGRLKEMFKYQSWHIVPSSLEAVLLEHDAIEEAVVFGVPHGEDGEVPGACIVVKQNCVVDKDEIERFFEEKVADREKLRGGITFLKVLPKTPTGKVVRNEVRDFILSSKKIENKNRSNDIVLK